MGATVLREVSVRYSLPPAWVERRVVRNQYGVAQFVRELVGQEARECVVAVYLDGRHRPIAYSRVHVGTANDCRVHPREVFQAGILVGATALVVAHNHPSGDPAPSRDDERLIGRLAKAGDLIGIALLDFVIVSQPSGVWSAREAGSPELTPNELAKPATPEATVELRVGEGPPRIDREQAVAACRLICEAYHVGAADGASIPWETLDDAWALAKAALGQSIDLGPDCGHAGCRVHWIQTGVGWCVESGASFAGEITERYWGAPEPGETCEWCGWPFEDCHHRGCDCPDHTPAWIVDGRPYCSKACAIKAKSHRRRVVTMAAVALHAMTAQGVI